MHTHVHLYTHICISTYPHTQIQILILLRRRIFKIYSLHLKFVVTKSGRFSLAFPAFSVRNINFYKLDGEITFKLQNEPFNILYYCSNSIRRNKFQKDKFPNRKLSSFEVPWFQYHAFTRDRNQGKVTSGGKDSDFYWGSGINDLAFLWIFLVPSGKRRDWA